MESADSPHPLLIKPLVLIFHNWRGVMLLLRKTGVSFMWVLFESNAEQVEVGCGGVQQV